jgi:hypothetical protein
MQPTTGNSHRAKSFGSTELSRDLTLNQLLLLVGFGIAITLLRLTFKWPLHLPGHHGLETMALLVMARLCCAYPWAATITAASAAATAATIGLGHGALWPVFYIVPGLVLDVAVRLAPVWRELYLGLAAALAHVSKPLLKAVFAGALGFDYGSLAGGVAYPAMTHIGFGFAGGMIGALLWTRFRRPVLPAG